MAKRGDNIYKRKDGRFEGRYIIGRNLDGTTKYGYIYGYNYDEVRNKLLPLRQRYKSVKIRLGGTGEFSDYMLQWLENNAQGGQIKESTYGNYYRMIYNHIIPSLGKKLPHTLTKSDIEIFKNKLKQKNLSDGTVNNVLRLLSAILKQAKREHIITENLCEDITLTHRKKKKIEVLTRSEQYKLEQVCLREKTGVLPILALYTGMRVGEISALKWSDVDLSEGLIYVCQTVQRITNYNGAERRTALQFESPKSESSERIIALSPKMVAYLAKCKQCSSSKYVVSCKGNVAEPRVCQYRFKSLLKKAGLEKINFHALRHTYATRCMEEGIDVKTLSQLMGHSTVTMTLRYGNSLIEHKKQAVTVLDNVYKKVV